MKDNNCVGRCELGFDCYQQESLPMSAESGGCWEILQAEVITGCGQGYNGQSSDLNKNQQTKDDVGSRAEAGLSTF